MNNQLTSLGIIPFSSDVSESLKKISSLSSNKKFIDCTFGGGGYSREILKFPNTTIQAIDRDKKALIIAEELEKNFLKDLNSTKQSLAN